MPNFDSENQKSAAEKFKDKLFSISKVIFGFVKTHKLLLTIIVVVLLIIQLGACCKSLRINESQLIKKVITQRSKIIAGQPVLVREVVKVSDLLKEDKNFIAIPKETKDVKIVKAEGFAAAMGDLLVKDNKTLINRNQLSLISKEAQKKKNVGMFTSVARLVGGFAKVEVEFANKIANTKLAKVFFMNVGNVERGFLDLLNKLVNKGAAQIIIDSDKKVVDVSKTVIDQNLKKDDYVVVEYQTEAPAISEETTQRGKQVTISAPENLGYKEITAYSAIPDIYTKEEIKNLQILWKESNLYIKFDSYDLNNNGKVDYVEWTIPHLSQQTYEIIYISNALKLDSNKDVVEDIYEKVSARQDQKIATINKGEYVKATFKKELGKTNDITIYAKSQDPDLNIKVYTEDGSTLVATFPKQTANSIGDYNRGIEKYTVFLTGLKDKKERTFLLKFQSGADLDYIVDPVNTCFGNFNFDCNGMLSECRNIVGNCTFAGCAGGAVNCENINYGNGGSCCSLNSNCSSGSSCSSQSGGSGDCSSFSSSQTCCETTNGCLASYSGSSSGSCNLFNGSQTCCAASEGCAWDSTAPVIGVSAQKWGPGWERYSLGDCVYSSGGIEITMGCDDSGGSGCADKYYCIDQTNTCTPNNSYTSPVYYNEYGHSYFRYYGVDANGNESSIESVLIDNEENWVSISNNSLIKRTTFTIDDVAISGCSNSPTWSQVGGSGDAVIFSDPYVLNPSISASEDGNYTIKLLGSTGGEAYASLLWDTTKPTSIGDNVSSAWKRSDTWINVSCSDSLSGCSKIYYTVDGSTPNTISSQYGSSLFNAWGILFGPNYRKWTQQTGGGKQFWTTIASSSDGTKLVAATNPRIVGLGSGKVYTSTDFGATWAERAGAGQEVWSSVASSSDGTKLVAVSRNTGGGHIHTSTNSGVDWTLRSIDGDFTSVASSSNGSKLAAVSYMGHIYTSVDSGATWTERATSLGHLQWNSIASSSDGTKLIVASAGLIGLGYLYTSTDSGATWTERTSAGQKTWMAVASSSDGTKLVAGVWGGEIYTSTDSGATWIETTDRTWGLWTSIASSSDGTRLAAVSQDQYIYTSVDSGVTWSAQRNSDSDSSTDRRQWRGIASSSDGTRLAAVTLSYGDFSSPNNGWVYTTNTVIPDGTYIISYRSEDLAGNLEDTKTTINQFKLDTASPVVDAGIDQETSAEITQDATASDERSGIATYAWSKVSGPGNVTFGSSDAEDTTVIADAAGDYVIRLTVIDNAGNSASDDFVLTWIINPTGPPDATPPIFSNFDPAMSSVITDATPTITFETDEGANCRASLLDDSYDLMSDDVICTGDGGAVHSCTMTDLGADGSKNIYFACVDMSGNKNDNSNNEEITYSLDTTAPAISNISPASSATISDTTPTITFNTNESADCRASRSDESYDSMSNDINCTGDGTTSISCVMTSLGSDGSKDIYLACNDSVGNKDTALTNTKITYNLSVSSAINIPNSLALIATGGKTIQSTWSANGNADGTTYYIENITQGTNSGWITTTFWLSDGLTCGTSYSFKVRARNAAQTDTTDYTALVSVETQACPGGGASSGATGGETITQGGETTQPVEAPQGPTIIEQIIQVPSVVVQTIQNQVSEIANQITDLVGKNEPQLNLPPVAEVVPITPQPALQGNWNITETSLLNKFVMAPLPQELQVLEQKFTTLGSSLKELGVTTASDVNKLRVTELSLPGISEFLNYTDQTKTLSQLTDAEKAKIPTEILFAKSGNELIDIGSKLFVDQKGNLQQKVESFANRPLQLIVKPEKNVNSVKGSLVFLGKKTVTVSVKTFIERLTAALISSNSDTSGIVEETLSPILSFEYTDDDKDGIYTANIQLPQDLGEYQVSTTIDYMDPKQLDKEIKMVTVIDPEGYVYKKTGDMETRINDAIVFLYKLNTETNQFELWNGKEYSQDNPQTTDKTGSYSFLVPKGYYYVAVKHSSYEIYQSNAFTVEEGGGIHMNIELKPKFWWMKSTTWTVGVMLAIMLLIISHYFKDKKLGLDFKKPQTNV